MSIKQEREKVDKDSIYVRSSLHIGIYLEIGGGQHYVTNIASIAHHKYLL